MLALIALSTAIYALPPRVTGDFDHDGKIDTAEIVKVAGSYRIVIYSGAASIRPVTIREFGPNRLDFFLAIARPGKWKTWCGKGGGSEKQPCPQKSITLKGGELTFGVKEASEWVVIWTGRRFEPVLLSD